MPAIRCGGGGGRSCLSRSSFPSYCIILHFLQGVLHCAMETAKLGPLAFYKVKQGRGWGRGAGQGRGVPSRAVFTSPLLSPSGPRACRHPPHAPHRAHVCVSGAASQTLWHQSAVLMWPWEQLGHAQPPASVFSRVLEGQQLSAALSPAPARRAPAPSSLAQDPRPSLPGQPSDRRPLLSCCPHLHPLLPTPGSPHLMSSGLLCTPVTPSEGGA